MIVIFCKIVSLFHKILQMVQGNSYKNMYLLPWDICRILDHDESFYEIKMY